MTINDLNDRDDLMIIMDSQEIADLNVEHNTHFGGFLMGVEDGEITELYGFDGSVPYLYKEVTVVVMGRSKNA